MKQQIQINTYANGKFFIHMHDNDQDLGKTIYGSSFADMANLLDDCLDALTIAFEVSQYESQKKGLEPIHKALKKCAKTAQEKADFLTKLRKPGCLKSKFLETLTVSYSNSSKKNYIVNAKMTAEYESFLDDIRMTGNIPPFLEKKLYVIIDSLMQHKFPSRKLSLNDVSSSNNKPLLRLYPEKKLVDAITWAIIIEDVPEALMKKFLATFYNDQEKITRRLKPLTDQIKEVKPSLDTIVQEIWQYTQKNKLMKMFFEGVSIPSMAGKKAIASRGNCQDNIYNDLCTAAAGVYRTNKEATKEVLAIKYPDVFVEEFRGLVMFKGVLEEKVRNQFLEKIVTYHTKRDTVGEIKAYKWLLNRLIRTLEIGLKLKKGGDPGREALLLFCQIHLFFDTQKHTTKFNTRDANEEELELFASYNASYCLMQLRNSKNTSNVKNETTAGRYLEVLGYTRKSEIPNRYALMYKKTGRKSSGSSDLEKMSEEKKQDLDLDLEALEECIRKPEKLSHPALMYKKTEGKIISSEALEKRILEEKKQAESRLPVKNQLSCVIM